MYQLLLYMGGNNTHTIVSWFSLLLYIEKVGNWFTPYIKYRKVPDRPRDPAKWDEIADVVAALSIPVIANGDVLEYDDFSRIKTATGTHMIDLLNSCSGA